VFAHVTFETEEVGKYTNGLSGKDEDGDRI
jgi:hypothetical protein